MSNLAQNITTRPSATQLTARTPRKPARPTPPDTLRGFYAKAPDPARSQRVSELLQRAAAACYRAGSDSPYDRLLGSVISTLAHFHDLATDTAGERIILDSDGLPPLSLVNAMIQLDELTERIARAYRRDLERAHAARGIACAHGTETACEEAAQ